MKVIAQDTSWYRHSTFVFPILTIILFFILIVSSFFWWKKIMENRIAFNIFVDEIPVGGLTQDEAISTLEKNYEKSQTNLTLYFEDVNISSSSAELGIYKKYQPSIEKAYQIGRSDSFTTNIFSLTSLLLKNLNLEAEEYYENEKIITFTRILASQIEEIGQLPSATIVNEKIQINSGKIGRYVDIPKTIKEIQRTNKNQDQKIEAVVITTGNELSNEDVIKAQSLAEKYLNKNVIFSHEEQSLVINDEQIIPTLLFPSGFKYQKLDEIIDQVTTTFTRLPVDAKFEFNPTTLKVSSFSPEIIGVKIKQEDLFQNLEQSLRSLALDDVNSLKITVPVDKFFPQTSLKDLNTLGIIEEIGFGESFYDHSISSRIHNVSTANKIVDNTIVAPDEEFSFNKSLGEVSQHTGFQQAYVIRSGATVLGDGGGVCQVSTTLFRALLDAGLNITKRKAHSYRVSYYEIDHDPGFDATVYSGDVDLRFINDSGHYILLSFTDNPELKYMTVHIYGTADGRTSEISNYQKWGYQSPPPPQYIDDPTLAKGKTIQIDWAVAGIKAKFTHTVRDKDNKIMYENEYYSNYIPWSAKYRRGIGT